MGITTFGFLCGLALTIVIFYLVSQKIKWKVLLAASLLFVCTFDVRGLIFILATSLSIWLAAKKMAAMDAAGKDENIKKKKRHILWLILVLNLGLLALLKYIFPYAQNQGMLQGISLLIPLGLSYYTLQAISYVVDVYWQRIPAEKSYGKVLLFICYFPQMIQGPISKYQDLSHEIYEKDHSFTITPVKHGIQLMLWGYFKTLIIGDRVMKEIQNIFWSGNTPYGLMALLGLAIYGIAIYTNFSGGIDIVRGASECFGITLPQNFQQPYFAKNLADFWRRWHMSLGEWMKDYAFYPLAMSKSTSGLKRKLKKHVSRRMANKITIAIANVLVFLLVGVWHGFGSNFAIWGLYNGIVLAVSELMEDHYARAKKTLHINEKSWLWQGFCMVRTFFVVCIGRTTDCALTAGGALMIVRNMLKLGSTNFGIMSFSGMALATLAISLPVVLIVDILHEKGVSIRDWLDRRPFVLQMAVWLLLICMIAFFGRVNTSGGFVYANY